MPTTLPRSADVHPSAAARHGLQRDSDLCDGVYREFNCVAGIYAGEGDARQAQRQLEAMGLAAPFGVLVLGPAAAGRLNFRQRARKWARRPHDPGQHLGGDPMLMSPLTALACALGTAAWLLLLDDDPPMSALQLVLAVALAAAVGAALGAALSLWLRRKPWQRHFDRTLRRQLQAGRWVLVVHDLPAARQAQVVGAIREGCHHWCGVSALQCWL